MLHAIDRLSGISTDWPSPFGAWADVGAFGGGMAEATSSTINVGTLAVYFYNPATKQLVDAAQRRRRWIPARTRRVPRFQRTARLDCNSFNVGKVSTCSSWLRSSALSGKGRRTNNQKFVTLAVELEFHFVLVNGEFNC